MCNKKCISPNCNNIVDKTSIWCEKCLEEVGKIIDEYPIWMNSKNSFSR